MDQQTTTGMPIESSHAGEPTAKSADPSRRGVVDPAKSKAALHARLARLKERLSPRAFEVVVKTPTKYLSQSVRALLGEASPRLAIKAHCEECVGFEEVKPRVGECKATTCRLWAYRPYQGRDAVD